MARDITSGFETEIEADRITIAVLIKIEFDSGDLNLTTSSQSIEFASETYTGAGRVLEISDIKEASGLEAIGANFTLTGVDSALVSIALAEDWQNRKVTIYFAPLQSDGTAVSSPYPMFTGFLSQMDLQDSGNTARISVDAEGDLIGFADPVNLLYTDESQRADFPNDTGLSYVSLIQDIEIRWGRPDSDPN